MFAEQRARKRAEQPVAQRRQCLWGAVAARLARVIGHGRVAHAMHAVLNLPVPAPQCLNLGGGCGRRRRAGHRVGDLAPDLARRQVDSLAGPTQDLAYIRPVEAAGERGAGLQGTELQPAAPLLGGGHRLGAVGRLLGQEVS